MEQVNILISFVVGFVLGAVGMALFLNKHMDRVRAELAAANDKIEEIKDKFGL